jgi:hypothetical protein
MLRTRRWFLPALGALALTLSGTALWKAEAQTGFSLTSLTATPNPVTGSTAIVVKVKVNAPAGTVISQVRAATLAGNGLAASGPVNLSPIGGGFYQGNLTAPKNSFTVNKVVTLRATATRTRGTPLSVTAQISLTVRPNSGGGGGTNPTRPPDPPRI